MAFAALLLGFAAATHAQAPSLEPLRFSESVRTDIPVAGDIFRGIHFGAADEPVDLGALYIVVPQGGYRRLCLDILTQDGKYRAAAAFDISASRGGGRYRIRLPTRHRRLLESLPVRDLSVLAHVSAECEAGERVHVPIQWGRPGRDRTTMLVLVNARTPSVDVRLFRKETRTFYACERDTKSEKRIAFDTECTLPAGTRLSVATIVILRNRFQHRLKDITITVFVP